LQHLQAKGRLSIALEPGSLTPLPAVVAEAARQSPTVAKTELKGDLTRACLALWIGPEGGWEAAELESLTQAGAREARMGQSVLRTETAGPVAVAIARLALGDW
jgi:RsmE family RNA methyltransferase